MIDGIGFLLGTVFVLWLAWLLLSRDLVLAWWSVLYLIAFWLVTAYVGLPRLQEILAKIYVPDYYIGRSVTGSGILGDPVNLTAQGTADQVHGAMVASGWTRADEVTLRSSWGIIVSAVLRRSYPSAPVSPLFLFGRPEAFAYEQQVGADAARRHHVRFWPTPDAWVLPGGRRVDWLAAGTLDRSVGLSLFTLQVTHKVDADIDLERDHVVQTVTGSVPEARVEVLDKFAAAFHARNGGGDKVHTDGNLVVLDLTSLAAPATPPARPARSPRLAPPALLLAGVLIIGNAAIDLARPSWAIVPSLVVLTLWLLTLVRRSTARDLLMVVAAAAAAVELVTVSSAAGLSLPDLLHAGVSVLILIVVSSNQARNWVMHRQREGDTTSSA